MIDISKQTHLVQTPKWAKFKEKTGNKVVKIEGVYIMLKKIPLVNSFMGYAPKVNFEKQEIDFKKLRAYCKENNISFVRFDVPNLVENTKVGEKWVKKLQQICSKSPRNTFTKKNIYLDLSPSMEELLAKMHSKKRYNIRYAERSGVEVKIKSNEEGFENFYKLHKKTAERQGFLIHPKEYYKLVDTTFKGEVFYLEAYVDLHLTTSWMILIVEKTMYYIYGGSTGQFNNKYPNDLIGFKAIELGKQKEARLFDMWGAEEGKGFTEFKLRYGGELLEYVPSYDLVIKNTHHKFFNITYGAFWKLMSIKNKLRR